MNDFFEMIVAFVVTLAFWLGVFHLSDRRYDRRRKLRESQSASTRG